MLSTKTPELKAQSEQQKHWGHHIYYAKSRCKICKWSLHGYILSREADCHETKLLTTEMDENQWELNETSPEC